MSGRGAERILDAVEWFATRTSPVTFTEFVHALDVPKSSAVLMLQLLVNRRYVERLDDRYRLLRLPGESAGGGVTWGTILRLADPHLRDAVVMTEESGFVAVLQDNRIRYLNKILPKREIRYDRDIAPSRAAHQVASGLVFLAGYSEDALARYAGEVGLDEAERAALAETVAQVRRDGLSININGVVEGASGIAAPVLDASGRVIAAINISGPRERFIANLDRIKTAVVTVAGAVTDEVAQRTRKSLKKQQEETVS
jgi:IclR family pca regulon transcriptional regulator